MPGAGVDCPGRYGDYLEWFGTDEACLDYLDWLRWPSESFVCAHWHRTKRWQIGGPWRCAGCRRWVSAFSGTLFAETRLPPTFWFHAAWRMAMSESGVSALELQRTLGISSYQSVWTILHRMRQAMGAGAKERLGGTVETDETFLAVPEAVSGAAGR